MFKKPAAAKNADTSRLSLDVPNDVLKKLETIARYESTWDASKPRVEVEDVVRRALNIYLKSAVAADGSVLPDVHADVRNEESPVVRLTNAVLVNAIQNGISEFQIPPADDTPESTRTALHFPEHMQPWFIRRLQVMTSTRIGTIPIVHSGENYLVLVEFDRLPDGRSRVQVRITRE